MTRIGSLGLLVTILCASTGATAATAVAQSVASRVLVTDSAGAPIPFAVVQFDPRTRRAASDSGVVAFEGKGADSVALIVRRIGFAPFDGWVTRSPDSREFVVRLARLAHTLKTVQIRAPSENRLYRSGFYTRMEERMRIAARSEFFTPEQLDIRNAFKMTDIMRSVSFLRIDNRPAGGIEGGYPVMGRGRCMANILVDGNVPVGLVEDYAADQEYRASFAGQARPPSGPAPSNMVMSIDRYVMPGVVSGVEAYASADGAPVELRTKAKRPNCPLIAIWTGPRQ
jgi:hypothetical protein